MSLYYARLSKKSVILTFDLLSKNYPEPYDRIGGDCKEYSNQCAIRMSRALSFSGVPLAGYRDPVCRADNLTHARGAESLAWYLRKNLLGPRKIIDGKSQSAVAGKKGIMFFKDIVGFRGGQGDHIDLWDGEDTRGFNGFGQCAEVWFWELD